jgi:hypothetical protein
MNPSNPRLTIREDAGPLTKTRTKVVESTRLVELDSTGTAANRKKIQIITPGWGSSGYYSAEVLERAATDKVIPAGTHMYLNHASESEHHDRPERDVEKIAAVLVEDATWDGTRLLAEADLMGPHAELISSLAPYIGVSISGSATDISVGEAEGRTGPIIEGLAHVESVDFVTRAGRGGMILLEAARPSLVNASAVLHGVAEATVNDTREALTQLLRDEYGGDKTYVWVRDFDDTTVWFEVEDSEGSGIYGQGYTQSESGAVALTGEWTEVSVVTSYVPVDTTAVEQSTSVPVTRPDSNTPTTEADQEVTMGNIQIDEAEHRSLVEKAGRVDVLESENTTLKAEKTQAARTARATTIIGDRAKEAGVTFTPREVKGLLVDITLTEAGEFDEAAFTTLVDADAKAKAAESAAGGPSGFGESTPSTEVAESTTHTTPWGRPLASVKGA